MTEDFFNGSYVFMDGGKVEIHFDSKHKCFIPIFSENLKASKQEWFSRVVQKMNQYIMLNHDPRKVYFKVELRADGKTNVETGSLDKGHGAKILFDGSGNMFVNIGTSFKQVENNAEIASIFKRLVELSEKSYDSEIEI